MSVVFRVDTLPKSPFRSINGIDYSVWSYKLSWHKATAPSGRVALVLPGSIDVQDPDLYPGEPAIQGCALFRSRAENRLYVSVLAPLAPHLHVTISFIAPSASNSAMALTIVEQDPTTESWSTLPFSVGDGSDVALVQIVEGPVEAISLVPSSPDLGKARGASRRVPKATLVSLQLPSDLLFREQGAAIDKYNFLQRLRLSPGEVDKVFTNLEGAQGALEILRSFEGLTVSSALPTAREVAPLPTSTDRKSVV